MALQAFARVVELGGFTKAATRRVTVTPDGAAFYERGAHILSDLDEAEASVMQARVAPKGRLRVDMPGGLARLFVIPRLPAFLGRYPDLRLELGMGLRPVDLLEEGIDCVVRFGVQPDSSLVARRVGTMSFVCCASPAYLREHGISGRPEEVSAHRCVNYLSSRTGRVMDWEFARDGQNVRLTLDGVLAMNDPDAYVVAGLMSFGIVKMANYVVKPYLESGQLVPVLTDWTAEQFPISVMYLKSRHLSAKVRIFVDWVSELIQQDPIFQTP